eukprot:TRINITY_DN3257_c0_g1_i13.p4 TRINITY_DN3257_c0_g1~~TRINITY_DN3257_c0_g1_i13.p4  ORF type:complete len:115 (+),score=10.67 TRINITY_DN3257_c0_g1_i13:414-758(+)
MCVHTVLVSKVVGIQNMKEVVVILFGVCEKRVIQFFQYLSLFFQLFNQRVHGKFFNQETHTKKEETRNTEKKTNQQRKVVANKQKKATKKNQKSKDNGEQLNKKRHNQRETNQK